MIGIVKWFNDRNGYGFIDCNNEEIFVHYSSIICPDYRTLIKDELVNFEIVNTKNSLKAKKVKSINEYGICKS